MSITLRRAHRDVLHAAVVADLSGVGDIYAALSQGDVEEARKLRQRFGLGMRLLDDLGWGEDDPGEEFAITMEPAALATALRHLNAVAADGVRIHVDGDRSEQEATKECADACEAIGDVLARLAEREDGERSGGW
ncbi:hypothetical protein VSS74_03620 [Conexibacter stalactiti]|uniref:Uncharacterized protein n=1 Tax=Conexibacter stalactiti TaxID=1940611 RepID=A0ABU4HJD0_9ACTN|nr:hypothetical protein [Conexibacter stalactiti]MDW5593411.1 hypothetical protein [Conexibacter stalactiti]MEC5034052.1 hypothetical protein [Conexibacter stalactiti]